MTVTCYRHTDRAKNLRLASHMLFNLGEIPDDLRDGLIVETAPDEDHFAVRGIIAEFFNVSDERLASIRAGDEDNSKNFALALAAYREGKADCDCIP